MRGVSCLPLEVAPPPARGWRRFTSGAASVTSVTRESLSGGVFVCLDLYRRSDLTDLLCDGVAYPAILLLTLMKTGKPRPPRAVREAYAAHGSTDAYLTLPQVGRLCADILPGALVRRHLFWRYSIFWKKETGGQT